MASRFGFTDGNVAQRGDVPSSSSACHCTSPLRLLAVIGQLARSARIVTALSRHQDSAADLFSK